MSLKLIKPSIEYQKQIIEMLEEWIAYNKEHPEANTSPWSIFKNDYHDFEYYRNHLDVVIPKEGLVPDSTYFCLDEERDVVVGAINIRHELNDYLLKYGGHIGDGIRPSERRKGYATKMIALGLEECKKLGIHKVLITCDKTNTGSAKSIIKNGGILENEVVNPDGNIQQRYWIETASPIKTDRLLLRPIKKQDWKAIKEIWDDFNASEFSKYDIPHSTEESNVRVRIARWEEASKGLEHMFFAVCREEKVIGYISLNAREEGYETGYCFHSAYHGKGYAKESLQALFSYLKKYSITKFTAGTAIKNVPSVSLLASLGFQQVDTEKVSFYKDKEGKDIVFDGGIFELAEM